MLEPSKNKLRIKLAKIRPQVYT